MAQGKVSAEQGAIEAGAKAVDEAKQGIDNQFKKVRGEIDQLRGYWTGDAAAAFTALMQQFDEKGTKLNAELVTLSENLRSTHKAQAQSEQDHQSATNALLNALNS